MHAAVTLEMRGIRKRFGDVVALDGTDFGLRAGEIHGLLGENGAGKTTLMNVLSGLYRADAGEIVLEGRPLAIASPQGAVAAGIGMVHQHSELVGHFTALENIILGCEGQGLLLQRRRLRSAVRELATRFGVAVDPDATVATLPVGVQQKVEILKALYRGARILILDEPTTLLAPQEVDRLFATLREVTAGGVAVVFITHKIREARAACDRITVMRRGRVVATVAVAEADADRLVELMIGARVAGPATEALVAAAPAADAPTTRAPAADAPAAPAGPPRLLVDALTVPGDRGEAVCGVTLSLAPGELFGIAGVSGNGQRELCEAILGARRPSAGRVLLDGDDLTRVPVADRLARGIAYIPEDRLEDGILPRQSVAETMLLGVHRVLFRDGRYEPRAAVSLAVGAIEAFRIACPGPRAPTAGLSGGNIQKLLVARALALAERTGGRLLVAMNPTRGLDVPSTRLIHERLRRFRGAGGTVLIVSEDLDELMLLCDRIGVLTGGRLAGTFARGAYDAYRIGALMAGSAAGEAA